MPTPGKPVFNPLAKSKGADAKTAKSGMTAQSLEPLSPQTLKDRSRKGISLVGTEDRLETITLKRATGLSALLHLVGPFALTAVVLLFVLILSVLMHFNFWDWFKAKDAPKDMEFTLVQDTHAKRPDKPVFKGNFNQRAGGKQNRKQPLKAIEEPPQSSAAQKSQPAPKPQPVEKPQAAQKPEPQVSPKPPAQKPKAEKPKAEKKVEKPAFTPTVPSATKTPEPLETKSSPTAQQSAKTGAQAKNPQAPAAVDKTAGASALSTTTLGNPQEGANKESGVDVAQDADFGPFMADLERRIKRNWTPPRGAESRKVVLLFYLARDGKVVKIEVKKTSGDTEADQSAQDAVKASAPFMAFPPQVREDILPIEFTFDYNVLNPKNPKQALKW